jgi:hypothetical protein
MLVEDGRLWRWSEGNGWEEIGQNEPLLPAGAVSASNPEAVKAGVLPEPKIMWDARPNVVKVVFGLAGGNWLVREMDWSRKVMLAARCHDAGGKVIWEETWNEERRGGRRQLLRLVHSDRTGQGASYEETRVWRTGPGSVMLSELREEPARR